MQLSTGMGSIRKMFIFASNLQLAKETQGRLTYSSSVLVLAPLRAY